MRTIKYIAIHCTATPQSATIDSIRNYWKNVLKWKQPGYHYIVKPDGSVVNLLDIDKISNGVKGYNHETINISYIGGIDEGNGTPKDTRTDAQKVAIKNLLIQLRAKFPHAIIQGHRDFPNVKKACPSFDAKKEYSGI